MLTGVCVCGGGGGRMEGGAEEAAEQKLVDTGMP